MVFTKKVTKAPAVTVETKKLSAKDTCGMGFCHKMKHFLVTILLIINTLLLIWIVYNQMNVEAQKVGGKANYQIVQQIYKSDAFKAQQKQQIEQALQMYQDGWTQQAATLPVPQQAEVQPAITQ